MRLQLLWQNSELKWLQILANYLELSIPVLIFCLPLVKNINNFSVNDWDQFFALYESLRKSVIEYHQFPWWNPWIAGGTPLFANAQVGVFSIQTILTFLFGTIPGIKISIVLYYLAGFWGMHTLVSFIQKSKTKSVLLSYLWVFSSFMTFHLHVGHYTFLTYLLAPWLIYFFLRKKESKYWSVACGLFIGVFINCAPSYPVLQALVAFAVAFVVELVFFQPKRAIIISDFITGVIATVLSFPKLFFSIQYSLDFPRESLTEVPITLSTTLRSFIFPFQHLYDQSGIGWGWWEVASYVGIPILILFFTASVWSIFEIYKRKSFLLAIIVALTFFTFLIGLGAFHPYAPYSLISKIPPFTYMHLSTRWFGWTFLGILLTIALFPKYHKATIIILCIGVIELFIVNFPLMNIFTEKVSTIYTSHDFQQYENFPSVIPGSYSNMFFTIKNNYGEIWGYEPMLGYNRDRPTNRCGINKGCSFVSPNAKVISWSPNKIVLERIGNGSIEVNMNPSSYWVINGKRMEDIKRVIEPTKDMIIDTEEKNIIIEAKPLFLR
jgi:hypothetical protein